MSCIRVPYNVVADQIVVTEEVSENEIGITGLSILFSVQRLSDGFFFDFSDSRMEDL